MTFPHDDHEAVHHVGTILLLLLLPPIVLQPFQFSLGLHYN